jgi:hypothetical protein
MLVAYKPYSLLDLESHPLGVLPETPWSMEYIEDSQAGDYAEQGWVIVTMDEYLSLVTSLSPLNSKSMALAAIKSGTIVLTPEQEQVIKDWYYTLNDAPVKTVSSDVKDADNRLMVRHVATKTEYRYSPRSLDFYTAKHGSLYNRSHYGDGTIDGAPDIGDAWLKFFDASNTEIAKGNEESDLDYQARLTSTCTKTVMYFEPAFDYDVFGAKLQFRNIPQDRAYFWFVAAPDVPAEYGGNVVFMGGGMNIAFFAEKDTFECDGKTVSTVTYDGTYHSGKVALIVKHNVGTQIGIQLIYQFYS